LFVRIKAPVGSPRPRLLVPERAVSVDQLGDYLMVVVDAPAEKPAEGAPDAKAAPDGKAATKPPAKVAMKRPAKLGMTVDGMRVVESGVTADDLVIVNGLQRARDGVVVEPEMEASATATAAGPAKK
jgi:hypothetical protein